MAHSGGAKLGTRIASIVSQTIVSTHAKLLHVKHRLALAIFHSISDIISEEVHRSLDPMLVNLHDQLPDDSPAKGLLQFMAHETGQLQAGAGMSSVAGSILGSLAQVVNNELSVGVRGILASNPHMLPDTGTISQLAAKGLTTGGNAVSNIEQQGIDSGWATAMIGANYTYPDPTAALDMLRRGLIDEATFTTWAQRNGIPGDVADKWLLTVHVPLSPADVALAVLRGNIPMAQAVAVAAQSGVTAEDFSTIIDNTGEPPGPEQLLEAHRRGFIDDARLVKGILQSRIRNEWVDVIKDLATVPISTADAVNAVVQNHLTQAQGEDIANQNGLMPGSFPILVETAGAPLSRTEMEELYNRGEVTQAQVYQALSESRLKPKYNDLAFLLHSRLLTPRELADMVVWGAISQQDAVAKAMESGYAKDDAARLVSSSVNRKLQSQRQSVVSAIEVLYEDNAISEETASSTITSLGFEQSEITFMLQAAELKRQSKLITAGLTAIRSKYIGHHIDSGTASSLIDAMGIPHQQRDSLLQLWKVEHDANVAQLTAAQILKALALGLITADDTLTRLVNKGYSPDDAALLIEGA
jgi:hypothetical protein